MKKLITLLALLLMQTTTFALATETENVMTTQIKTPKVVQPVQTNSITAVVFSDVKETDDFYVGIKLLSDKGVINGYSDGTYKAQKNINRAEMLKIVIESSEVNQDELEKFNEDSCFEDVPTNEWYTKYVCYAKNEEWIRGYDNGKYFKPNQDVSFVEGLKMTMAVFQMDFVETGDVWYEDMVKKASASQLIPNSIDAFDKVLNRGEMSDMAGRAISSKEGKLKEYLGDKQLISHTFESIQSGITAPTIEVTTDVLENITSDEISTSTKIETNTEDDALLVGDADTDDSNTQSSLALKSIKNWATFDSLPFEFTCEYPELWYYFGTSIKDDDTIIRHYGFSTMSTTNEDESVNEDYVDMVSIDILSSADEIDGTSIATAGKELTISQVDGVFTVYLIVDEKPFRVRGAAEYKNIVLAMAKSIEHKVHEDDTEAGETPDQARSDIDDSNKSDTDSNQNTTGQNDTISNTIN